MNGQTDRTAEAALPLAAIAATTAAIASFALAQGLSYPLFTQIMQRQGLSPAEIGLSTAMTPVGLIVSSFLAPAQVRLFGAQRLGIFAAALAAAVFAFIAVRQDWLAWYPARFVLGLAINPLYILGEVWTMTLTPAARRGRVMGVFNTVTGLGYATGPLALGLGGPGGAIPFALGIGGFLGCAALLAGAARRLPGFAPAATTVRGGVPGFWLVAPTLLAAVTASAMTQQSTYALLPVFATGHDVSEARAAALVAALSFGNIVLQTPLGLLAERYGYRRMILTCASVTGLGAVLAPWLVTTPGAWPLLMAMGGCGYGVYTMALVGLGERFRGEMLVTGNAAFALMWGVGGIMGPPLAGAMMQLGGPDGLVAVISGASATLIAQLILRRG